MKGTIGIVACVAALSAGCYSSGVDGGDDAADRDEASPDIVEDGADRADIVEDGADLTETVVDDVADDGSDDIAGDAIDGGDGCVRTDDCSPGSWCNAGTCELALPTLVRTGADMTCLHDNPPPVPGTGTIDAVAFVEDFLDGTPVEGAIVDFFFDDVVDGTPDSTVGPTDAAGEVWIAGVPRFNLIAYRVRDGDLPGGAVRETIAYDVRTPDVDGAALGLMSVADRTYRLIPTILGIAPDALHGVVFGRFDDCVENPVEGFVVRFLTAAGEDCHVLDGRECYSRYFVDRFPARIDNQTYSSADGLFAVLQVPPGMWAAQVLARLGDGSVTYPYDLVGEKAIGVAADAVTLVHVEVLPE
jgi:hypothetical protein